MTTSASLGELMSSDFVVAGEGIASCGWRTEMRSWVGGATHRANPAAPPHLPARGQ